MILHAARASLLAIAVLPVPALAEWTLVGAEAGIYRAYADPETLRRQGGSASMQGLYDFERGDFTPQGRALRSTSVHREYDCDGRRVRLLAHVDHAGAMGGGEPVSVESRTGRWEPVIAASLDERFWALACAAR